MTSPELENLVKVGKLKREARRNLAEYEGALDMDERLLADLVEAARTVLAAVRALPPLKR